MNLAAGAIYPFLHKMRSSYVRTHFFVGKKSIMSNEKEKFIMSLEQQCIICEKMFLGKKESGFLGINNAVLIFHRVRLSPIL